MWVLLDGKLTLHNKNESEGDRGKKRLNWDWSGQTKDKMAKHLQSHSPAKPFKIPLNATFRFLFGKKKKKKSFPTVKYPSFGVQYISRLHQNFKIGHSSHLDNTQVPWKMLVGLALKHETPACPIKWTYIFFFSCKTKLVVNCTLWEEGGSGGGVGGITATVINTTSFIHYCSRPVYSLLVHWRPHVYFT